MSALAKFSHAAAGARPDRYAAVSADGKLCCWDTSVSDSSLDVQFPRPSHLGVCWTCLSWKHSSSEVSEVLAMGADSGIVVVWDITLGHIIHELHGHTQSVNDCAFSVIDGGATLLTCGNDRKVCSWDSSNGSLLNSWSSGNVPVYQLGLYQTAPAHVLLGSTSIKVVLVDGWKSQCKLSGHSNKVPPPRW